MDSENTWQNLSEWKDLWDSRRPGKHSAMNDEQREVLALPPNKFTIYRGTLDCSENGLSLTISHEKAI